MFVFRYIRLKYRLFRDPESDQAGRLKETRLELLIERIFCAMKAPKVAELLEKLRWAESE